MLSRLLRRSLPLHLRTLTLASSSSPFHSISPALPPPNPSHPTFLRPFSSSSGHGGGGDDGKWSFPPETDEIASIFGGVEEPTISGIADDVEGEEIPIESKKIVAGGDLWAEEEEPKGDIFEGIEPAFAAPKAATAEGEGDDNEWETAEGYEPWSLGEDGGGEKGVGFHAGDEVEERTEEQRELERKEEQLVATLKGESFDLYSIRLGF